MAHNLNNRIHTQAPALPNLGQVMPAVSVAEQLKRQIVFALSSVQIAHSGLGHEEVERRIGELRGALCHPDAGQDPHRSLTRNPSASVEILKQVQDDMGARFTRLLQSNSVPEILHLAGEIAIDQSHFNFRRDVLDVFVSNLHFNATDNPSQNLRTERANALLGIIRQANPNLYESLMNETGLEQQVDLHEISTAARSMSIIGANNNERFGAVSNLFASFASGSIAQRLVRSNNPRALIFSTVCGAVLGSIQGFMQLAYVYRNESMYYVAHHANQIAWQMTKSTLIGAASGLGAALLSPYISNRLLLFLGADVLPEVAATELLQHFGERIGLEQERHLSASLAASVMANSIEEVGGDGQMGVVRSLSSRAHQSVIFAPDRGRGQAPEGISTGFSLASNFQNFLSDCRAAFYSIGFMLMGIDGLGGGQINFPKAHRQAPSPLDLASFRKAIQEWNETIQNASAEESITKIFENGITFHWRNLPTHQMPVTWVELGERALEDLLPYVEILQELQIPELQFKFSENFAERLMNWGMESLRETQNFAEACLSLSDQIQNGDKISRGVFDKLELEIEEFRSAFAKQRETWEWAVRKNYAPRNLDKCSLGIVIEHFLLNEATGLFSILGCAIDTLRCAKPLDEEWLGILEFCSRHSVSDLLQQAKYLSEDSFSEKYKVNADQVRILQTADVKRLHFADPAQELSFRRIAYLLIQLSAAQFSEHTDLNQRKIEFNLQAIEADSVRVSCKVAIHPSQEAAEITEIRQILSKEKWGDLIVDESASEKSLVLPIPATVFASQPIPNAPKGVRLRRLREANTRRRKYEVDFGSEKLELVMPWLETALDLHEPKWRENRNILNTDFNFILRPNIGRELFSYIDQFSEKSLGKYKLHIDRINALAEKIKVKETLEKEELEFLRDWYEQSSKDRNEINLKIDFLTWLAQSTQGDDSSIYKLGHDLGHRTHPFTVLETWLEELSESRYRDYNEGVSSIWDLPPLCHVLSDPLSLSKTADPAVTEYNYEITNRRAIDYVYLSLDYSKKAALLDVLTNLLSNSWRYRSSDKPKVKLDLFWFEDGSLEITLRDDGIGIAPENIFRLGSLHFREGRKEVNGSHGDGLNAVIQNLRELGFGPLWVRSEVGLGSSFRFVIPSHFIVRKKGPQSKSHNPKLAIEKSRLEGFYVPDEALDLLPEEDFNLNTASELGLGNVFWRQHESAIESRIDAFLKDFSNLENPEATRERLRTMEKSICTSLCERLERISERHGLGDAPVILFDLDETILKRNLIKDCIRPSLPLLLAFLREEYPKLKFGIATSRSPNWEEIEIKCFKKEAWREVESFFERDLIFTNSKDPRNTYEGRPSLLNNSASWNRERRKKFYNEYFPALVANYLAHEQALCEALERQVRRNVQLEGREPSFLDLPDPFDLEESKRALLRSLKMTSEKSFKNVPLETLLFQLSSKLHDQDHHESGKEIPIVEYPHEDLRRAFQAEMPHSSQFEEQKRNNQTLAVEGRDDPQVFANFFSEIFGRETTLFHYTKLAAGRVLLDQKRASCCIVMDSAAEHELFDLFYDADDSVTNPYALLGIRKYRHRLWMIDAGEEGSFSVY